MTTIANTLGVGSGIDTQVLIDALVSAERAPRDAALKLRSDKVEATTSGLAQLKSGFDALVTALATRTRNGALGALPASSDTTVLGASALAGAVPGLQPVEIDVRALAAGQTLVSTPLAARTASVGTGTLTLTMGTMSDDGQGGFGFSGDGGTPVDIVIAPGNDSLSGLRDAINTAQSRVVASIIDDGSGARLVLKGPAGAAAAFILTATPDSADLGLERFVYKPGTPAMTAAAQAGDAELVVDGVTVHRAGNTINDLIGGVQLELRKATPGLPVRLAPSRDPAGLQSAISDTVAAFNALQSLTTSLTKAADAQNPAGALVGDSTARSLRQQLASFAASSIIAGSPGRLSDIGIETARDGSLVVNAGRLSAAVAAAPDTVEKMLVALTADGTYGTTQGGLVKLSALLGAATTSSFGTASRMVREQTQIARESSTLDTHMTSFRAQLVRQYAAMETAVAGFKATQSFLEQQVNAWNNSNN